MENVFALPESEKRKIRFLYHQSGIHTRHSVLADYSRPAAEWKFYPHSENLEPFPGIEKRMDWYGKYAAPLSVDAIRKCISGKIRPNEITHLITVSCTGMSAPGLDLQVAELMDLPRTLFRTSVNFMGCYAAIHALKLADVIAKNETGAKVMIVCTELCTLHFQREPTPDNIMSSLLFSDGSAAALVVSDEYTPLHPGQFSGGHPTKTLHLSSFYSEIIMRGKKDMAWEISSTGFQMTLSGYIPDLIEEDFEPLMQRAIQSKGMERREITHWCIHPGGRKILDSIARSLKLEPSALGPSYHVLAEYGNMSSATILFVLQRIMLGLDGSQPDTVFAAAFGPGLTMETFIAKT